MNYYQAQIKPILEDTTEKNGFLRVKIESGNYQTKWLNISKKHIKALYDDLEGED